MVQFTVFSFMVEEVNKFDMNELKFFVLETEVMLFEFKVSSAPSATAFCVDKQKEPNVGERLLLHIRL